MAPSESDPITSTEQTKELKLPFLSLIPKILLGFLNRGAKVDVSANEESAVEGKAGEGEDSRSPVKPNFVTFRSSLPETESLKLEREGSEQNSNPVVLWEVYILGGFILFKWGWAKWQERQGNAKKKNSADDKPPPQD
ncbi:hypothetical protein V2J09_001234 [Rumex salicifolius]